MKIKKPETTVKKKLFNFFAKKILLTFFSSITKSLLSLNSIPVVLLFLVGITFS